MTDATTHNRIPISDYSSEEIYTSEPFREDVVGDWHEYDVLNREIQALIDKLPKEHQIELFVSSLRKSELHDVLNNLLRDVVSAVKTPDLYPLSCLYLLNSLFSKTEEIITRNIESKLKLFKVLADSWHEDTDHQSFSHIIISHEAYLKIIAMGSVAIPLILRDLQERGGNWYVALQMLSDQDPVPLESKGDVPLMKESWLRWGRDNGYIE